MADKGLNQLKQEIEKIDHKILDLLNQRAVCAQEARQLEGGRELPAAARELELEAMRYLLDHDPGPIPSAALEAIFREIISACRALQEPVRVAFLGPEATFSHLAVLQYFGSSCKLSPQSSIIDVFQEVERDKARFGVVPVENSTEGAVNVTLDGLTVSDLVICGELFVQVSHVLMSQQDDLRHIERVISHPQPLSQCRGWLTRNLPGRNLVEASSTSAAAQMVRDDKGAAAVGSELLAKKCGLHILARDIQDSPLNLTRFFVLGKEDAPVSGSDKTSILFVAEHKPGSLYRSLKPFAEQGINLTRIESRPTRERAWEYVFFLDFMGHKQDDEVRTTLAKLQSRVEYLKVLGSYPRGDPKPGSG
jgi:chorismate mutase/prephenate dehydratase